jgi:hypothetical protein
MAAMEASRVDCANCGTPLAGRFCHACGQKRIESEDRRFAHLVSQFVEALTDLDSRFWRSLRSLMFRPGRLSAEYLAGRRARYMGPVALFVIANVLYFVAPGITDFELGFFEHVDGEMRVQMIEARRTLSEEDRRRIEDWGGQAHTPWTRSWIEARVATRDAAARTRNPEASYTLGDYQVAYDQRRGEVSRLLIILHVPVLALLLMLMHPRQGLHYAEHFVVALHLFAFVIFFVQLVILPGALLAKVFGVASMPGWVKLLATALLVAYTTRALQVVYRRPLWLGLPVAMLVLFLLGVFSASVYRALQFLIISLLI